MAQTFQSSDGDIRVWEAETGKDLATIKGPKEGVLAFALSRDGRQAYVSGAPGHAVVVYDLDTKKDQDPRMSSVYRWRAAFQADFAARLDWCVKPFKEANHPPVVQIKGLSSRQTKPGESITLDASASTDPDGNRLCFCTPTRTKADSSLS